MDPLEIKKQILEESNASAEVLSLARKRGCPIYARTQGQVLRWLRLNEVFVSIQGVSNSWKAHIISNHPEGGLESLSNLDLEYRKLIMGLSFETPEEATNFGLEEALKRCIFTSEIKN